MVGKDDLNEKAKIHLDTYDLKSFTDYCSFYIYIYIKVYQTV